jgi:capsid protein
MAKRRRKRRKRPVVKDIPPQERSEIGNQVTVAGVEIEPITVRRWDAAITNRLNKAHWQYAHGNSINQDLATDLETLRARANYEAANNPLVEGVINTHAIDVVGKDGPRLQVQSDDTQYNEQVERWWDVIFEDPSPTQTIHGAELLRLWVMQLWKSGEYLNEEVTYDRSGSDPTQLGIATYHPRRWESPTEFASDPSVAFGIRFNARDQPVQYYIRRTLDRGNNSLAELKYEPVAADMIQHVFSAAEPDQIRGYPWLASSLGVIADLRQFDQHVMESAKNSAAQSIYHYTDHPDAVFVEDVPTDNKPIETGTERYNPVGWKTTMLSATQPNAEYKMFRHERLRELGRPVCMPLMVVLLSSADSNFASAHYDGQVYMRAIEWLQSFISRRSLTPYVRTMARELALAGVVSTPARVRYKWTWPKPPYVNPKQMYDALRMQLEDGTATYADVLAAFGREEDSTIESRIRTNERLAEAGLPPLPINYGSGKNPEVEQQEADAKTKTAEKVTNGVNAE